MSLPANMGKGQDATIQMTVMWSEPQVRSLKRIVFIFLALSQLGWILPYMMMASTPRLPGWNVSRYAKIYQASPVLTVYSNHSQYYSAMLPDVPKFAPEYGYFDISYQAVDLCNNVSSKNPSRTFVHALQLCLGAKWCYGVSFNAVERTSSLCNIEFMRKNTSQNVLAVPGANAEKVVVTGQLRSSNVAAMHPCRAHDGRCLIWDAVELKETFNDQAQKLASTTAFANMWKGKPLYFRAFNPGIVRHNDEWAVFLRISNFTNCPWMPDIKKRQFPLFPLLLDQRTVYTTMVVCKLEIPSVKIDEASCTYLPLLADEPLILPINSKNSYNIMHPFAQGMEDARPFIHKNKMHAAAYRKNMADGWKKSKEINDYETAVMLDIEFDKLFRPKTFHGIICSDETEKVQKNWMPLSTHTELMFVSHLAPLTIMRFDAYKEKNKCYVVYQEQPPYRSYKAVAPGLELRGGSNFIKIEESQFFLGLAHTTTKSFVYHHHLILLERTDIDEFNLSWISEAFRLPRSTSLSSYVEDGDDGDNGIQFSMSIERYNEDLVMTYGDADCEANIAFVRDFFANLEGYVQYGLHTHPLESANDLNQ